MREKKCDVVIVGSGVAGLYSALKTDSTKQIVIITKAEKAEDCDSYLAQGGICMLKSEDDYEAYFEDTMRAGHYENTRESVDIMIRSSRDVIKDLIGFGVDFERNADGSLKFTREGAHSSPRILFHEDITGEEITKKLLAQVRRRANIEIIENTTMLDIITTSDETVYDGKTGCACAGVIAKNNESGELCAIKAQNTIWATGGIGGLFAQSTNFPHLTGDALAIALKHGIALKDIDYIQIHPTTLFVKNQKGRAFLISESVRGEGGILLDKNGKRFVNELLPRDVVAAAIFAQMKKDGTDHVWLSMENISENEIRTHFTHIYEKCKEEGYDCTKEPIPVVPAQHYFMGGVAVNSDSRTTMAHLYAAGETSCNGVHGANRLASNSLLESLVFASRAARAIDNDKSQTFEKPDMLVDESLYQDTKRLEEEYKNAVKTAIHEQEIKRNESNHNESECRPVIAASA